MIRGQRMTTGQRVHAQLVLHRSCLIWSVNGAGNTRATSLSTQRPVVCVERGYDVDANHRGEGRGEAIDWRAREGSPGESRKETDLSETFGTMANWIKVNRTSKNKYSIINYY